MRIIGFCSILSFISMVLASKHRKRQTKNSRMYQADEPVPGEKTFSLKADVKARPLSEGVTAFIAEGTLEETPGPGPTPKPVPEEEFVDKLFEYIIGKYGNGTKKAAKRAAQDIENLLQKFYNEFDDWNELEIFTANAIFTTGGFKNMSQKYPEPVDEWFSRGILQICTEGNYRKLAEIMEDEVFITNPDILASFEDIATEGSIAFWKLLVEDAKKQDPTFKLTWDSALKLLNTYEVQPEHEKEWALNKANRLEEYNNVRKLFGEMPLEEKDNEDQSEEDSDEKEAIARAKLYDLKKKATKLRDSSKRHGSSKKKSSKNYD